LLTVVIFVSCEEKGCYRIVSLGHQNFGGRSYCGLSRRMQGYSVLRLVGNFAQEQESNSSSTVLTAFVCVEENK